MCCRKNLSKKFFTKPAIALLSFVTQNSIAQEDKNESIYHFTDITVVPHTPVPNQYRSGTCWSFSGAGHVEAELLRITGKSYNLSEMFFVRHVYSDKAKKYIRTHGNLNLASGGGFSDIFYVIKNYGLIPESAYPGLVIGEENHVHGEMDAVLKAYTDAVLKNPNKKLTPVWHKGFDALLDTYLGVVPENFEVDGQTYTPLAFARSTGLNPDDYIELTSFTHREFYKPFIMELPDNWMWSESYNIPLDEMMLAIDNAIESGYTVAWDADVSDKGFNWKKGLAIIPDEHPEGLSDSLQANWDKMSKSARQKWLYSFETVVPELKITPEIRQQAYDNYETTDDHNMLIVGIAKDQLGNKFYKIKNSWGTDDHIYDGYFYASESYMADKTLYVTIHRDGIPKNTLGKLGL